MFKQTKWIIAGALVFALLVAGVGGTIAFAQGPAPAPAGNAWMNLYWQTLAQKLGTTVEKLQQATNDARVEAAKEGVKQGVLTQAQADRMLGGTAYATIAQAGLDAAAKALGMSSADLQSALRTKSLLTLAQEKKVDVATLRTAIADAQKAAIDQAVKDGKLTQAQADAMKANLKPENIDLNRPFFFGWGIRGDMPGGFYGKGMPPSGMGMPPSGRMGRR
jgi:uncharacterized protein YidB (DUF937 family)